MEKCLALIFYSVIFIDVLSSLKFIPKPQLSARADNLEKSRLEFVGKFGYIIDTIEQENIKS